MVTIIGVKNRKNENGKEFIALQIQGGIELVQSKAGKTYASAKTSTIPSTFSEAEAKKLIGAKLPGAIIKQQCEPYSYIIPDTKEVVMLDYNYVYCPSPSTMEEVVFEGV